MRRILFGIAIAIFVIGVAIIGTLSLTGVISGTVAIFGAILAGELTLIASFIPSVLQYLQSRQTTTQPGQAAQPAQPAPAPPGGAPSPAPRGQSPNKWRWVVIILLLLILLVPLITYLWFLYPQYTANVCGPYEEADWGHVIPAYLFPPTLRALRMADGECVGLSYGGFAFDTDRTDGDLKLQAAEMFRNHEIDKAKSLWEQAHNLESDDAETLIYRENQRVLESGRPYITLVVITMLTSRGNNNSLTIGRDNLQGAYVAQMEYNNNFKLPTGLQVRFLIANIGSDSQFAVPIGKQIQQAAQEDHTIVGVMGWPISAKPALPAIQAMGQDNLTMVSPTASADDLSTISPFFFRVCPSNKYEAEISAKYIVKLLNNRSIIHGKIALFVPFSTDINSPYAKNLADDFTGWLPKVGNDKIVVTETYHRGKPEQLAQLVQDALSHSPDAIYFAGYSDDASTLLDDLAIAGSSIPVVGGDALYSLRSYPGSGYQNSAYGHLYFTTFAFPDEWNSRELVSHKPVFFDEYSRLFDDGKPHKNPYGFTRADSDVMLSYDATKTLLEGVARTGQQRLSSDDLRKALTSMNGDNPVSGVSGLIYFNAQGDPTNKAMVVLRVNPQGFTQQDEIDGQLSR